MHSLIMIWKSKQTAQSGSFQLESKKGNTRENSTIIAGKPKGRRGTMCAHFVLVIYYNMGIFFLKREEKRVYEGF